jgi:hypothetical protein
VSGLLGWLWLKLTFRAVCEGGPFDGELRPSTYRRITVKRNGSESRWHFAEFGEPLSWDLGCYKRVGTRFVWCGVGGQPTNREKVDRWLEIERIIKETIQ